MMKLLFNTGETDVLLEVLHDCSVWCSEHQMLQCGILLSVKKQWVYNCKLTTKNILLVMARYSHKGHDTVRYDITQNIAI